MMKHSIVSGFFCFVLPGFLLLLVLGFWQVSRGDEKQEIEETRDARQTRLPQRIDRLPLPDDILYHQVVLVGRFRGGQQFIYDNQTVNGQAGYHVLTPFVLEFGGVLLVNRGFVPWEGRRELRVDLQISNELRTIKAELVPMIGRIRFDADTTGSGLSYPKIIQSLDVGALVQDIGESIPEVIARLGIGEEDGFGREWVLPGMKSSRHYGYAFQWFALACSFLVWGIFFLRRRRR